MARLLFSLLLFWSILNLGSAASANRQTAPIASIKEGLNRFICYGVYWQGQEDYRLDTRLQIEIKEEEEKFFAWIEDLVFTKYARMPYFFTGSIKNGKAVVTAARGYNINVPPPSYLAAKDRRHFETGSVIKDILITPADCTPRYDRPTPEKSRMLEGVERTIQKQLTRFMRQGVAEYPPELTLTIADFNVDYPRTYVLIEPPVEEVWSVGLGDHEWFEEKFGEYPSTQLSRVNPKDEEHRELISKIRKHGFKRTIVIRP